MKVLENVFKQFIAVSLLLSAMISMAMASSFDGVWGRNREYCNNPDKEQIIISRHEIIGYEWSCVIRSTRLSNSSAFIVGDCTSEAEEYRDQIQLTMSGSRMFLTSNHSVSGSFIRCR